MLSIKYSYLFMFAGNEGDNSETLSLPSDLQALQLQKQSLQSPQKHHTLNASASGFRNII